MLYASVLQWHTTDDCPKGPTVVAHDVKTNPFGIPGQGYALHTHPVRANSFDAHFDAMGISFWRENKTLRRIQVVILSCSGVPFTTEETAQEHRVEVNPTIVPGDANSTGEHPLARHDETVITQQRANKERKQPRDFKAIEQKSKEEDAGRGHNHND